MLFSRSLPHSRNQAPPQQSLNTPYEAQAAFRPPPCVRSVAPSPPVPPQLSEHPSAPIRQWRLVSPRLLLLRNSVPSCLSTAARLPVRCRAGIRGILGPPPEPVSCAKPIAKLDAFPIERSRKGYAA